MSGCDENLTLCSPRPSSGLNPHHPVLIHSPKPSNLPPNHVLIKVDRFGFSTNNISYQALGEAPHFRYFEFHPAPEAGSVSSKTHGLIPVWGFGTIAASTHPKIQVGERVYGYLAPTRYLLLPVSPADVNKYSFYVPRPHLPADRRPYNQIQRCATDDQYDSSPLAEDYTMLYRPLFWTSYWCEDWLYYSGYRGGATRVLISSASSKTAFCLAYLIRKRIAKGELPGLKIVGLTSRKNVPFTKGLRLYEEVLDYDTFSSTPAMLVGDQKWIYADVAGNRSLNERVFTHFGDSQRLVAAIQLGLTNLSPSSPDASSSQWSTNTFEHSAPLNTSATSLEQFFMPEWLVVRKKQMPVTEISNMQVQAWKELMRDCGEWVELEKVNGGDTVKKAYEDIAKGGLGPDKGQIWSLWEDERTTWPNAKL